MRQAKIIRNIALGIENLLLHKTPFFSDHAGDRVRRRKRGGDAVSREGASKEALEQIRKLGSNNVIISSMKS